ncbi:MAG: N-6 DNA methylase [Chloroflexi bacterium]|nr:N-6 DNA methylase [Chloroflexota bacterium]
MWNWQVFQSFERPEPLPANALAAVREGIFNRGFLKSATLEDYAFASFEKERTLKTNLLAFAHLIHRTPDYAALTVFNAMNGLDDETLVSTLAQSSAPFHILHRDNEFSFWAANAVSGNNQAKPILVESHISYDRLDSVLNKYDVDLRPQRIIDVKQGRDTFTLPIFRQIQPLQLSLWAANVTRKLLVKHFALAVEALRNYARAHPDIGTHDLDLTSLSIKLLGAIILADTGVFGDTLRRNHVSLARLIEAAYERFDRYFQPDLFEKYHDAAEQAYYLLRQVCYAGFVPDMLTELYREAYDKEQRRQRGRFDTPLFLTRRIWENIPVEYLPPDQRVTVDMTCGWGSFLVAAHERLSNLIDAPASLLDSLHGNDDDPFTAMLAGSGLLLSTSEDSWHIDGQDALQWDWLRTHQPNIIVGNPPFKTEQGLNTEGERRWNEEANKFLGHAIECLAPNGYLAMLMPRSFATSRASPVFRKQLLEHCDVFELWELPTNVFASSSGPTVRPMVLFARKSSKNRACVRVRTVQPATYDAFKNSGLFTVSPIVADQAIWNESNRASAGSQNTYLMDYYTILPKHSWYTITSGCVKMSSFAEIIKGASKGKPANRKKRSDYASKMVPWLDSVKGTIDHLLVINYERATTILYPDDLERPRLDKESILAGVKVLVSYSSDPSWGKRVKLAIERNGYYVSDNFWVVAPRSDRLQRNMTCEVLAAILNWDVANAWLIEQMKSASIPSHAMRTIPVPSDLSSMECSSITEAMLMWEEEAYVGHYNSQKANTAKKTIDTILKAAYHLDDATFQRLRKVMEWDNRSAITLDPNPESSEANWSISGIVDSIDVEDGTITLWMMDFRDLQTVRIVPTMPGWMLRPEAAFRTKIPRHYVKQGRIDPETIGWGVFRPQSYAYMNEEELLDEFSHILHADDPDRVVS